MKVIIYGSKNDCTQLRASMNTLPGIRFTKLADTQDYDDLRRELAQEEYSLVIVAADGAQGMEACIGARKLQPDIPLFWFSDDPNFAPQSYRLSCTYFATKPVPQHRLKNAFARMAE